MARTFVFGASIAALALWQAPASACSWPAGLFNDTIRESRKIDGSLRIVSVEEKTATFEGKTTPWSKVFHGVVTDGRQRPFEIEFEISSSEAIRTCTPFTLPEGDVSGTFYLKSLERDGYELVHWKADT